MKSIFTKIIPVLLLYNFSAFGQKVYNIKNYGAKADRRVLNTVAIQKAIDAATKNGGGRVLIPDGDFITGPIFLKSNVELHLTDNAVLLGSANSFDYKDDQHMSVLIARNQQNISVTGTGIIDGQGGDLVKNLIYLLSKGDLTDPEWKVKRPATHRPNVIAFADCKKVKVKGVTIKNSASWVQDYNNCTNVVIDSVTVESTAYWNNDGIDMTDCHDVKITNCNVNAADDAICLKSDKADKACENITVENCTLRSSANGFKFGTGSVGGFKHIRVNNLVVYNTYRSAIALETVDGAVIEDVDIRNVKAIRTGNAIFLRLGHRNKDERYGTLKNVYIGNVHAEIPLGKADIGYPIEGPQPKNGPHNVVPSIIAGIPGHEIEGITLENIDITYEGGANKATAEIKMDQLDLVNENIAGYPEFSMFGEVPSWGFYIRHAKGITLKNVKFSINGSDFRPALISDDVQGLSIEKLQVKSVTEGPVIVNHHVSKFTSKDLDLPVAADKAVITN